MNFNKHFNLEGKHAILGASKYHWINYDDDEIIKSLYSSKASEIGTILHSVACDRIKYGFKLTKHDKRSTMLELLRNGIPASVVNYIDFDAIYDNLMCYTNDCIGFKMEPEVVLRYSDICFGTADAIQYSEKDKLLRIHDLKTGTTPAHMEQLLIYAAMFFLEYKEFKVANTDVELRIYQSNDILIHNPEKDEIVPLMDEIKSKNDYLMKLMA